MKICGERLLSDLNTFKSFTDTPGDGVTRFSYGESDVRARSFIKEAAEARGFYVKTDPVGNIYIGVSDRDTTTKKICVGSHIDTVRSGGWLDGIYGVVSALEVLRTLAEHGNDRAAEVEVVVFAEEEGSNFGSTMTGSKFAAGIYGENDLDRLKNDAGISLREMLLKLGCPPYRQEEVRWDFSRVRAMLELHIEQGPILEQERKAVGVVESIFGMTVMEVTITGVGNHAGATPMKYRQDAMTAAAQCVLEAERIVKADPEGIVVATVGKMNVFPNCSNVIPEKVVFTVEVREKSEEKIRNVVNGIEEAIRAISRERRTACDIRILAESKPFRMDERIIRLIEGIAEEKGIPHRMIDSGAVHDTCVIAPHVPSGMLFVPSKGGRSHVPFEDTDAGDLFEGAQLLLETVLSI